MATLGASGTGDSESGRWLLPGAITVLALADGFLHLALDFVLFHGNLIGGGPPPGGPRPGGGAGAPTPRPGQLFRPHLPLNELFWLNTIGYVVLVAAFWLAPRLLGPRQWLVDVAMIVYAAVVLVGWVALGQPNPMGLGYLSKAIEIVLIVAVAAHAALGASRRGTLQASR